VQTFQRGNGFLTGKFRDGIILSFAGPEETGPVHVPLSRSHACTIPPVISIDWLEKNISDPAMTIIDIRDRAEYLGGHIPQSVNVPFSEWISVSNGLLLELPDEKELFNTIGSAGIHSGSQIIIVNKTDNPRPLAYATRVADTLIHSGIIDVSILNGGYKSWESRNKQATAQDREISARKYKGNANSSIFTGIEYVRSKIGKSLLLDARDPEVYFGLVQEPTASRPGHIPGAKNLPAPWIWDDGKYRSQEVLQQMAVGVTGKDRSREIILYCGVGGYAAAWWYVLTQMLGYENVRIYNGSAQEWTADPQNPLVSFIWE